MIPLRKSCLTFICIFFTYISYSQDQWTLRRIEDSLSVVLRQIRKSNTDSSRLLLNDHFRVLIKTAIDLKGSFNYPFDSLKNFTRLTSPDDKFRIYNWNLPLADGSSHYYCMLQMKPAKGKTKFTTVELHDCSDTLPDPEHSALGKRNWYGAVYYKIIHGKRGDDNIYTLLGWEGKNSLEMQKVIEVLGFSDDTNPVFGKPVFSKYKDGRNLRIIFTYSSSAPMVLRYEEQAISKGKKYNPSTHSFKEVSIKTPMIVCDRLVPVESVEGKGMITAPAGDVYDGFIFENGEWSFVQGVDARNR